MGFVCVDRFCFLIDFGKVILIYDHPQSTPPSPVSIDGGFFIKKNDSILKMRTGEHCPYLHERGLRVVDSSTEERR